MNNKTKKLSSKGWAKKSPKRGNERNNMMRKCGKKCFLGSKKSFPICSKNTCKVNLKGVYAAYVRAKQWENQPNVSKKHKMYKRVAKKSKKMLKKMGYKLK